MFTYCICIQYLVGAPFAWITALFWRGMEVISLWHCWGGMETQVSLTVAFSSSAFLDLLSLIFLLTIPHIFSMEFRSGEFAGQLSTPTPWSFNQLLVLLAVWAGAKFCWKMKSASLNAGQQKEAWSAPKFLGKRVQWRWFSKTSRWHCTPNHHRLWKLNTGLQATWAMIFSTLPPEPWFPNTKNALIWKEDFGPLGNSPVLLLLSPGKTPLTTTVAKFFDTSMCGGSWCLDPSLSPFLVKFTQILESILLDNPHKGCGSLGWLCIFFFHNVSFHSTFC